MFNKLAFKNRFIKHSLKVTIAAFLALITAQWLEISNANWAAWTATTVMLPNVAASLKKSALRLFGTWVASFVSILLFGVFFQEHILFTVFYGCFILFISYRRTTSNIDYFWWIQGSVTIVVTLGALAGTPHDAIYIAVHRTLAISIGVIYAFFINFWVWPYYIQNELHEDSIIIRKDYFKFLDNIYKSLMQNSYDHQKTGKLFQELYKKFTKIESKLKLSLVERKLFPIKEADCDITINELKIESFKLYRFYKTIYINNPHLPPSLKRKFRDIFDNLKKLLEILYSGNEHKKNKLINNIETIFEELSTNDFLKGNNLLTRKSQILISNAIKNLARFFFYLKNALSKQRTKNIDDTEASLLIEYSRIKDFSLFGIHKQINIDAFKSSLKTAICFIISLWFLFYFEIPIEQAGVLMMFAAILYMDHEITGNIKSGVFIIGGSFAATFLNLFFMFFFPDNPPILYIAILIAIFVFAYLRTNSSKDIQRFSVWGLVGFLSCQTGGFSPLNSPWPILTSLVGAVLGIILVYIIDNTIWRYNLENDFKRNEIAIYNIFKDINTNFQNFLKNKRHYFYRKLGTQLFFEQISLMFQNNKITEKSYLHYNDKVEILRWLFFEIKSLIIEHNEEFTALYDINPDFFNALFAQISDMVNKRIDRADINTHILQQQREAQFTSLKKVFFNRHFYNRSTEFREKSGESIMIIRRVILLLSKYENLTLETKAQ